jgi:hypothetical protein
MGSGVAGQCSRNRCLAHWTAGIARRGRRGRASRANSKKDLVTGPIRGSCALQAHSDPIRSLFTDAVLDPASRTVWVSAIYSVVRLDIVPDAEDHAFVVPGDLSRRLERGHADRLLERDHRRDGVPGRSASGAGHDPAERVPQ